jgi:hypothetical protein
MLYTDSTCSPYGNYNFSVKLHPCVINTLRLIPFPYVSAGGVGTMDSADDDDEDEDDPLIAVGGQHLPLSEVTQDIVARMTPAEKENYIRISQQMYQDMYD